MTDLPDLAHLRALMEKATPLPWSYDYSFHPDFDEETMVTSGTDCVIGTRWYDGMHLSVTEDNGRLIVAAVNALPALLTRIEKLEKVAEAAARYREWVDYPTECRRRNALDEALARKARHARR